MHLIWITPEFPSSKSNTIGIYIYRTVKELAKYYRIHVICLYPASPPFLEMLKYWRDWRKIYRGWKNNYPKYSDIPEGFQEGQIIYLRYFRLPRVLFHNIEGWFAYIQARKYLSKIIDNNTIIHANWIFPAGTMASILSKKFDIPFIISLMGSDVNRLIVGTQFWKAAKKLLSKAHKITAVTEDLFEKCAEKNILIEKSKKELISNFYETDKFIIKEKNRIRGILGISNDIKMVFYAGGLIPLKNVNILIEAISNVSNSHSNLVLYIAGTGTDEGLLKRLTESKGIKKKVFFLGTLLSDDLINYYNAADVVCLQSKSEGLPNVIVESFFCGTPVVASAVGGIPTIVKEGVNGFLVKPNSIGDLEEKIIRAINYTWDKKMIRQSVSFLFSDNVINKYHTIYNSLKTD